MSMLIKMLSYPRTPFVNQTSCKTGKIFPSAAFVPVFLKKLKIDILYLTKTKQS